MSAAGRAFVPPPSCWRTIGVEGDLSCPELTRFVHCRNCPVMARAAEALFERPSPPGYAEEWGSVVAEVARPPTPEVSVIVFRVLQEHLALDTRACVEVATLRPIHRVAHRMHTMLSGLVNIRGELRLCVSLEGLFGMASAPSARDAGKSRLVVLQPGADTWVFRVSEVFGVHRFRAADLDEPLATLPASLAAVTRGVFPWDGRRVTWLHAENLAAAFERVIR